MTRFRSLAFVFAAIAALVFQSACSDSALTAIAKAMPIIATANQGMLSTVTAAQASGAMTADEARPLVQINLEIAQAGIQVDAAIKGLSTLNATQKASVLADLQPVSAAITNEINNLNIGNATTKTAILAALTTLQAALASVTAALG